MQKDPPELKSINTEEDVTTQIINRPKESLRESSILTRAYQNV